MYARGLCVKVTTALSDTPVVLVNGARQSGKTTLVQELVADRPGSVYRTLDDAATLAAAVADPVGFVRQPAELLIVDEVQHVPALFPAIQEVAGSIPTTSTRSGKGVRVVLAHFSPSRQQMVPAAMLLLIGGISIVGHQAHIGICPLRRLTGIPCPTCGTTRAVLALLRGDWSAAFTSNPLASGLALAAGLYAVIAAALFLVKGKIPVLQCTRRGWMLILGTGLLLAVLNWIAMMLFC
jgi:hypothetical protein